MTATVPAEAPMVVELCSRSERDSIELAIEDEAELFTDGRAPYTLVELDVGRRVTSGVDGDLVRLRVLDVEGDVLSDESRTVDYLPLDCGCYRAQVAL